MTVKIIYQGTLHLYIMIVYSNTGVNPEQSLSRFFVAGINYRHATVTERSLFSITQNAYGDILKAAQKKGIRSLFALSTCNRTELYGYCHSENILPDLLFQHTKGTADIFREAGFTRQGHEALKHLFHVAAGLDSHIIGDYEVLGQLKSAIALSRKQGMIGPVMDRTINFALQASKSVKSNTQLSTGTVSVSYAAIEWLKKIENIESKKILLYGTGKFGTTLAKNLKHYLHTSSVTIINRTDETARLLADSLSLLWKPFSHLTMETKKTDIIIVCTNATEYTLLPQFLTGEKSQWILDLSVPENVAPGIKNILGTRVTGIDEVSQVLQATVTKRKGEIPKALSIIEQYQHEFYEWLKLQRHVPLINDIKGKLYALGETYFCSITGGRPDSGPDILNSRVNKTVGSLAMNLRYKTEKGCHYINAINEFLQPGTVNG
jgi:glutamyl-tRNA reductase